MTGFLPNNGWKGVPYALPPQRNSSHSIDDSMRRNRVLPPAQCRDNRAKLDNLRRLIAGAEREYREMSAELDRLNDQGRLWLVVDLIHKTSLASLDLAAALMQAKWSLGLSGGVVFANPIPQDSEIAAEEIEPVIAEAVAEAERKGIRGKELTPFLLARIAGVTEGRSLAANIALVLNNAKRGAEIAVAYARLQHQAA